MQAFLLRRGFEQALDTLEKALQLSGLWRQLQVAGFDLGQVQAVAHQRNQLARRTMGHLQRLGNRLAACQTTLLLQFEQANDGSHGGANLVAQGREKCTFGVVRFVGGLASVHQLALQVFAFVDIDPTAQQSLQTALGIKKRHGPLVDVITAAVELQLPVDKQRLLRGQLLHVAFVQPRRCGVGHDLALHQRQALDQLQPGRQLLFITFIAGHQAPVQVADEQRVGHAVEQCALERQLVIEPLLGLQPLVNLALEPAVPHQRHQHKQQRRGHRPIGPCRYPLPGRQRNRHGTDPTQAQGTQLSHRQRLQGLVQNAQQLRLVLAHRQAVGRPLAIDTASDTQAIFRVTLHFHFSLNGSGRLAPSYQLTGLVVIVHQAQRDVRMRMANIIFQYMTCRQRQHLAVQLLQAGERRGIGTLDKHPAGPAIPMAEVEHCAALAVNGQGRVHLRPACFQPFQGLRGGVHLFKDKLQTGHARDAMQQIHIQANPVAILILEYVRRHLLGHHHDMGMLAHPGLFRRRQRNALTTDTDAEPGGPARENFALHRLVEARQRAIHHGPQQRICLAGGEGKTDGRQPALLLDLQPQVRPQRFIGAHNHFVADKRIDVTLLQGFEAAVEVGGEHDVAVGIRRVHLLHVGVAVEQHQLLAGQIVALGIVATQHHHRAVGHVVRGELQAGYVTLVTIGTGENVDGAVAQGFNRLGALGKAQHLHGHTQPRANQAQIIGADALVAIAVAGDIDRLVVIYRDAHFECPMRRQPLLLRRRQRHRFKRDKRRHQFERQADGGQAHGHLDEPQQAHQLQRPLDQNLHRLGFLDWATGQVWLARMKKPVTRTGLADCKKAECIPVAA